MSDGSDEHERKKQAAKLVLFAFRYESFLLAPLVAVTLNYLVEDVEPLLACGIPGLLFFSGLLAHAFMKAQYKKQGLLDKNERQSENLQKPL